MKSFLFVLLAFLSQLLLADDNVVTSNESIIRVTNKANGFQSQVANNTNLLQVMEILQKCNSSPHQIIEPITIGTLNSLQLLNPFTGKMYIPNWANVNEKKISSQFPLANFNAYIKTKNTHAGFWGLKGQKTEQELTMDYVRYQDVVMQQYTSFIPSLVGFGFRAKLVVVTKGAGLDASKIIGIPSLNSLQLNKNTEILSLSVQDLGVTSPSLVNQLNKVNSATTISEKLKELSVYQSQIQNTLSNPDDSTIIRPVIFAQKLQCNNS
ncbi:hypothetical protein [Acinetobacter bereziniae]|uniref:hypothetical protein n=1 Tax=Acinetobacter bereziniae TaxID=106648 RepID=UPI0018FF168E|nr:hypothetical protein [Acinetobacter bereziniae]MBJ8424585.1 hypothetical protein [Acinetobacter bereziniae]MCU4316687.1 hypothetical protein [Acinetobacter bereziniae]